MNPPKSRENTITRYTMAEEPLVGSAREAVKNYDLLSIIMLCLGGRDRENYEGILRMLDVLLSSEIGESDKRKILQEDYDIQMTQAMDKEVSVMCNLSKGIEERGMAKGIAEGMANGILFSIRSLMETTGMSAEQAMAALKVPEAEYKKYTDLLEK